MDGWNKKSICFNNIIASPSDSILSLTWSVTPLLSYSITFVHFMQMIKHSGKGLYDDTLRDVVLYAAYLFPIFKDTLKKNI